MKELGRPRGRKPADRRDQQIVELTRRAERAETELGRNRWPLTSWRRRRRSSRSREISQRCWSRCSEPRARAGAPSDDRADSRRAHADHRHQPCLSEPEREAVFEVLHSQRFVDVSPEETYATLPTQRSWARVSMAGARCRARHTPERSRGPSTRSAPDPRTTQPPPNRSRSLAQRAGRQRRCQLASRASTHWHEASVGASRYCSSDLLVRGSKFRSNHPTHRRPRIATLG